MHQSSLYFFLCRSYSWAERFTEALDTCPAAVKEGSDENANPAELPLAHAYYAAALAHRGKNAQAEEEFAKAVEADPTNARVMTMTAEFYRRTNAKNYRLLCETLKKANQELWHEVFPNGC